MKLRLVARSIPVRRREDPLSSVLFLMLLLMGVEEAMPQCSKCSREMSIASRAKLIGGTPAGPYHVSQSARRFGHPALAVAIAIGSLIGKAANKYFEEVEYRCIFCGTTATRVNRKEY